MDFAKWICCNKDIFKNMNKNINKIGKNVSYLIKKHENKNSILQSRLVIYVYIFHAQEKIF